MTIRFIGEIGVNHNRDFARTLELIRVAKKCGFHAVKFQMFDQRLYRDPYLANELHDKILPFAFLPHIRRNCDDLGLEFHCTPFHPDFVPLLDKYVDAFKIGSYEILWLDLIEKCAATGKPLGISTGGATDEEIRKAFTTAHKHLPTDKIVMYHCMPFYPVKPGGANLSRLGALNHSSNDGMTWDRVQVGYSDHTKDPAVILAAAHFHETKSIEMHLDLEDGQGGEFHYGHCWKPAEAKSVIDLVRRGEPTFFDKYSEEEYQTMRASRTDPSDGARPMLATHSLGPSAKTGRGNEMNKGKLIGPCSLDEDHVRLCDDCGAVFYYTDYRKQRCPICAVRRLLLRLIKRRK